MIMLRIMTMIIANRPPIIPPTKCLFLEDGAPEERAIMAKLTIVRKMKVVMRERETRE